MDNVLLVAQIIGFIAFAISTLKYQMKCSKKLLWQKHLLFYFGLCTLFC